MKKLINITVKGLAVMLIACLMAGTIGYIQPAQEAKAASKKITRLAFIKGVVDAMTGQECSDGHELTFTKNSDGSIEAGEITKKKYSKSDIAKLAKKYKVDTADAQYIACAMAYGIITKSTFKSVKSKITVAAAGIILAKADRTLRIEERRYTDEQIKEGMSMIADIKKIKKTAQRKLFAEAYMDGFFFGKKTGDYVDARKLSPTSKLTASTAKKLYAMVSDTSKRYQLSPHYQMLRNTKKNLPKNAECYAYILDSYPNAYYETGWHQMELGRDNWDKMMPDGKTPDGLGAGTLRQRLDRVLGTFFAYPKEMDELLAMDIEDMGNHRVLNQLRTWENIDIFRQSSIEFYELALNVDYKTIKEDKEWQKKMLKFMEQKDIDKYIEDCIKNKTIIECDKVAADWSAVYWAGGHPYLKLYAHVRVVSDAHIEERSHWDDEIYGNLYPRISGYDTEFLKNKTRNDFYAVHYKMGEWMDLYTVTEGCDSSYDSGKKANLAGTHAASPITVDRTGLYPWLMSADY